MIIGITPEGYKEVIDYAIAPQESVLVYSQLLDSAKARELKEVDIFVTDGFTVLADALLNAFLKAKHQRCWVHIARNIQTRVRQRDRQEILRDLKLVYAQKTAEAAEENLEHFLDKWAKIYPFIGTALSDLTGSFTFYEMPSCIRASIYTTNLKEGFNKQLKHFIGHKEQFSNEESLERFICSFVMNYNLKGSQRIHRGFK